MYRLVVVKVGTSVITDERGALDTRVVRKIVGEIAALRRKKIDVALVTSGAVGTGRGMISLSGKNDATTKKQVFAAIGQVKLMGAYGTLFEKEGQTCAQVLATKEDFRDRHHYLNMKNCIEGLLANGIVPIVNENDVVAVGELMFTDNDELAGLAASQIGADALVIFTSVEGVLDGRGEVIGEINASDISRFEQFVTSETSDFGRGGMLTKFAVARTLARVGIATHIVEGRRKNILRDVLAGKRVGTKFVPERKLSALKRRVAHSEGLSRGAARINTCAAQMLCGEKAVSLLLVGVTGVEGAFKKGDVIEIRDEHDRKIGFGVSQYDAHDARASLGAKRARPLIHYNYMYIGA